MSHTIPNCENEYVVARIHSRILLDGSSMQNIARKLNVFLGQPATIEARYLENTEACAKLRESKSLKHLNSRLQVYQQHGRFENSPGFDNWTLNDLRAVGFAPRFPQELVMRPQRELFCEALARASHIRSRITSEALAGLRIVPVFFPS